MPNEKRVIALGFFDGVHIGHAALLKRTVQRAREIGALPSVLSFDIHPDTLVFGKEVPLINVSNFLGHSTISTTANIYAHLDKAAKQSSADVISDIFRKEDAETAG